MVKELASRETHPEDSVIRVGDALIGGGSLTLIAGPCSVETEEQIVAVARGAKEGGAQILRGGAFKARSSPYSFQGLGEEGISLLLRAKEACGLPIITEITDAAQLPLFEEVDILQVGARNMQNYTLLKALAKVRKPVLLKRGLSATYEEWLLSAEYLMAGGNTQVILCERGIRTFETETRNTLDLTSLPLLKERTHLPILVDPSHACGRAAWVPALAKASVAAGADGLLIEVHNDPANALCDGPQSMTPEEFVNLAEELRRIHALTGS